MRRNAQGTFPCKTSETFLRRPQSLANAKIPAAAPHAPQAPLTAELCNFPLSTSLGSPWGQSCLLPQPSSLLYPRQGWKSHWASLRAASPLAQQTASSTTGSRPAQGGTGPKQALRGQRERSQPCVFLRDIEDWSREPAESKTAIWGL